MTEPTFSTIATMTGGQPPTAGQIRRFLQGVPDGAVIQISSGGGGGGYGNPFWWKLSTRIDSNA